ncbi:tRNA threonylcarbamoyladenosine biosynthesis protein TsaE [Elusimicrobium posterum]|uniref:tRNA (adenosine(37)-N6)-threonylcarbamoyltransferase complex ATPase subunit type 1 TsaE n=1 Tax=Elusimicrobium posterum TaxID=3116653 RepID=UPI003C74BE03
MNKIISNSPEQTQQLAAKMAALFKGGEIVFLRGPIGAGKTIFVKSLAASLGLKGSPVSASFSIMKEYKGKGKKLYHVDLFRLDECEIFNLGFEEMLEDEKAVIVIEWPDAIENVLRSSRIDITFTLMEGDGRELSFTALGKPSQELINNFFESVNNAK